MNGERETRVTTIRLPADQADEAEFIARVDGIPVSELVRDAIAAYIAARRDDREFQDRLRQRIEADQVILQRLKESA
jgi:Ribbon-helix-helix protein, copG family